MVLPHGPSQLCSVARRNPNGLGANVESLIEQLPPSFSVCLYGAYQSIVATALADVLEVTEQGRMFCRVVCIEAVKIPLTLVSCFVMCEALPPRRATGG